MSSHALGCGLAALRLWGAHRKAVATNSSGGAFGSPAEGFAFAGVGGRAFFRMKTNFPRGYLMGSIVSRCERLWSSSNRSSGKMM